MRAPRFAVGLVAVVCGVAVVCSVSCAALLNADFDRTRDTDSGVAVVVGEDGSVDTPVPPGDDGTCAADRKLCNGACVLVSDPLYGCGTSSCTPCSIPSATATCSGVTCAVGGCAPGRSDCDGIVENGCEIDVSGSHDDCGQCANPCDVSQVCSNGTCGSTCPGGRTNCGGSCVDLTSDSVHCGTCTTVCVGTTNGSAACGDSACGTKCNTSYHSCDGECVANTDPSTCGTSCTPCPVPSGGSATCNGVSCGGACSGGADPVDGSCSGGGTTTTCDSASCNGCCMGTSCLQGNVFNQCGVKGATCASCKVPDNGMATCNAGVCGTMCNKGYLPCTNAQCCKTSLIFVTSGTFMGNLGGLAGADAKCTTIAHGAGLAPSSAFKAWLSTSSASASSRLAHSTGPYLLTNGTLVANDWAGLTSGSLKSDIDYDETGAESFQSVVYTATTSSGAAQTMYNCLNWTSASHGEGGYYGSAVMQNSMWTVNGNEAACDQLASLYCVEQ